MKALILAAGLGKRLNHLTQNIPKALVKIKEQAVIDYVIEKIAKSGIKEIIVNGYYEKEKLFSHLQKTPYSHLLKFSSEETLLNTGGSIKKIFQEHETENLLVYNTDVLCTININSLIKYHKEKNSLVTMVMQKRESNSLLPVDEKMKICGLKLIKQQENKIITEPNGKTQDLAFCGIHILNKEIINYLPLENVFSVIHWYLDIMKVNKRFYAYQLPRSEYWLDMGTPKNLAKAEEDFLLWNR